MTFESLRFRFELRPLDRVPPWGRDRPKLHWFGLTDGWYWISAGGHELLRYRDEAVRRWKLQRPYPDYSVARLWEDVIILRWVLEQPVPDDLAPFVDGGFPRREFPDTDDLGDDVDAAFGYQSDHLMYLGHLTDAPTLACRRQIVDGRDVVILSQHLTPAEQRTFAGPPRLDVTVPTAACFAAIDDLHQRLIAAMDERVATLERDGPPPGVDLDIAGLRDEHTGRSRWLERRLSQPRDVDWAAVRAGFAEISSWPPAQPG